MKVLKFGGTSVGSVKSILSLKRIVENEAKKQSVVVVVSALGGITDKLLQTSQLALKGDEQWKVEFDAMVDRHHKMIDTIITDTTDRENLFKSVDALFEQLKSIYFGVYLIHDLSEKTQDAIVSYGERLSSKIVATLIRGAKWFDSRNFINIAEPIPPIFTLVLALSQNPITVISSFLTHRELSFQKREPDLRSYHSTNPALRIVISCEIGKSVSSVYTAVA